MSVDTVTWLRRLSEAGEVNKFEASMLGPVADEIERLRKEVAEWKDRWEASDQALDTTIKSYERKLQHDW